MNNLGWYQRMTIGSKKVGGPINFMVLLMGGGYIVGKGSEFAVKKVVKFIKKSIKKERCDFKVFTVTNKGKSNDELEFNIGDKYKVLELDGESILIEKIGDSNNPYFVSADFLNSISDFNMG